MLFYSYVILYYIIILILFYVFIILMSIFMSLGTWLPVAPEKGVNTWPLLTLAPGCVWRRLRKFISPCLKGSEKSETTSLSLTAPCRIFPLPLWSYETEIWSSLFSSHPVQWGPCPAIAHTHIRTSSGSTVWRGKNRYLQGSCVSRTSQGVTLLLPKMHFKNIAASPQNSWLFCAAFLTKTSHRPTNITATAFCQGKQTLK